MTDPTKQLQQLKREIHDRLVMYGSIASGFNSATSPDSETDKAKLKLMLSNLDLLDAEHLEVQCATALKRSSTSLPTTLNSSRKLSYSVNTKTSTPTPERPRHDVTDG
ncbi:hypothetical protein [Synechococcus sp. KORDI-52]|uniref:hypothetical protein n=1 Tax=Synechococcus sp. KORDI-52 TaxID=585425 RepID=UPI000ACE1E66|nr:hypothetical protein [Synechococcus sp. KORDI-52]